MSGRHLLSWGPIICLLCYIHVFFIARVCFSCERVELSPLGWREISHYLQYNRVCIFIYAFTRKPQIDSSSTRSHFRFCQPSEFGLWFSALSWWRAATTSWNRSASVLSTNQDLFIKHAAVKHREKLHIQPDIIKTVCISTDFSYRGILQEQFFYLCEIHGCRWISPLPLRQNSY